MKELDDVIMHVDGTTAYLPGVKAAVLTTSDTTRVFAEPDADPKPVTVEGMDEPPKVIPWGEDNNLPQLLIEKVFKVPQMTSNMWFNIVASYGSGIKPVRIEYNEKNQEVITPYIGNAEVKKFFEENDIDGYALEQFTDMHWFFNVFPEIIFNKEDGDKRKIVELNSKEAAFSRWSEMNAKYEIEYHYYYGYWGDKEPDGDKRIIYATPVLNSKNPVRHLRKIMKDDDEKEWNARRNRFIIPVTFPTPGCNYYSKPYWLSLIESGWYDFAVKIPEFKTALMTNKIAVKYIVSLAPGYFQEIFKREKITDEDKQTARIKKEYADIKKFIKGSENAGQTIITMQKVDPKGEPYPMIKIEMVPQASAKEGGDYIEDSEEVSNIISYGMLVHPSLVGATPGKNKNINGTEARELFIMKQAILKPFRDRILRPLYLIKAINKWPEDLHFVIPHIELTTLDKDSTGSKTKIETT